ncbi:endonuclease/exonuclease/phosphatase family protein [Niveibacterium sp. SC-1]|uniref:endonuclease/exonuclease/phosphatase family protein n=1 Tax=Niveibacterium sp. SC-1 TaxID=3135646 RepID=UPI00311F0EEB
MSETRAPWPLTVASYNVHGGVGPDGERSYARIADVLNEIDADIVALQEVPLGDSRAGNMLPVLAARTGMVAVEGPTIATERRRFGNAVLCRHPVLAVRNLDLSFSSWEARGALDADIECHGQRLRVVATHLGLLPGERRKQVRKLLSHFDTDTMPVMLLGDLNEWFIWGRPLRWLAARFQKTPSPATFPSRWPVFALDRIWFHPRERLVRVQAHATQLAQAASDHLPIVAHIGADA